MGLKESIQSLMPRIITTLGTLASDATYHSTGTFVYDPATGLSVESGSSDTTIKCVITEYTQEEIKLSSTKSEIFQTDKKILIPSLSLPNITPKMTDYLTINSETYKIISKSIDPAEAMWQLQGRV